MKGLNLEQVEKVLNLSNFICEYPGCINQAAGPGFKIPLSGDDSIFEFVHDKWNEITGQYIIDDLEIIKILTHDLNTFRSCEKHIHELEINIDIDPQEVQNILESIYRAENAL